MNIALQFLLALINLLILREYFNALFTYRKLHCLWHLACCLIFVALQAGKAVIPFLNSYVGLFVNALLILAFCCAIYSGKKYKKVIYSIIYITVWGITKAAMGCIMLLAGMNPTSYFLLMGEMVSMTVLFFMVRILNTYVKVRTGCGLQDKDWMILLLLPVICIAAGAIFGVVFTYYSTGRGMAALLVTASILLMNLLGLVLYEKLFYLLENRKDNDFYHHQLRLCNKQTAEREEEMLKVNKLKHDIKNHLACLWELTEKEEKEKLLDYLDQLIKDGDQDHCNIVNSSNIVIDALVNQKYAIAEKHQIDLQINITVPYRLPYDDGDICIILGNALDNAIEAVLKEEVGKRYINLELGAGRNVLTLVVKNSYNGVACIKEGPKYRTSDKKTMKHGLGLSIIRKAIERYNGDMLLEEDGQEFSLTVLLYARNYEPTAMADKTYIESKGQK